VELSEQIIAEGRARVEAEFPQPDIALRRGVRILSVRWRHGDLTWALRDAQPVHQ
jgi:hypothetical protein